IGTVRCLVAVGETVDMPVIPDEIRVVGGDERRGRQGLDPAAGIEAIGAESAILLHIVARPIGHELQVVVGAWTAPGTVDSPCKRAAERVRYRSSTGGGRTPCTLGCPRAWQSSRAQGSP